jgi:hypothetical protein
MAYSDVSAVVTTERMPGDLYGAVEAGFVNFVKARMPLIADSDDQREAANCRRVLEGDIPTSWIVAVLLVLDEAGELAQPPVEDKHIDLAITTTWQTFFPPAGP